MEGRTTIVIAHRIATIVLAERVVLLDRGRIVGEGTHEELIRDSFRYRQVLAQLAGKDSAAPSAEDEPDPRPKVLD
jgi:ATP-binding cassette subfamily B protein